MSKSLLASHFHEFVNPSLSRKLNIDDEGNEETVAVCDRNIEVKSVKEAFSSVSKLRQKNAQLLGETDPRYRGKKTSRKNLQRDNDISHDPELAKFCVIEEEEEEEEETRENEDTQSSDNEEGPEDDIEESFNNKSIEDAFMRMADDDEEINEDDENGDGSSDNDDQNKDEDDDNSDYNEDDEILDANSNDDENKYKEDITEHSSSKIQTFSQNEPLEMPKATAVKNQCYIYDKLFEARIGLQKLASITNQLPQFDKYKIFLDNVYYPLYKEKFLVARKEIKKLLAEIVKLQETLLRNNQETSGQIEGEESMLKEKSESVIEKEKSGNEIENEESKPKKRSLEEYEEVLRKRHKNMIPFRDATLNKWYERSKLLAKQSKKSNFSKFEISPSIQIKNILANKDQLIKKTRLIGVSRGTSYKIMGKKDKNENSDLEEYDPEIFDDSDFYSRILEDFLKSKLSVSNNVSEMSSHWVTIQKLRKKSKKKVEANANKGRKLRHDVITKQQNFMAPCKYSTMSDEATNKLFSSLFGGSVK